MSSRKPQPPSGVAFLLSQLGSHVSRRLGDRLRELDLSPAHLGVLRVVGQEPGIPQSELARRLGVVPSRVVVLVDQLEERGVLERRRSESDRRQQELRVAEGAGDVRRAVMRAVSDHDQEICASLSAEERDLLLGLLTKVADDAGLRPGQHPGQDA